jgi:hypothetical protein
VNLSAHPARIKQTRQSNGLSVGRIEVLVLPVASVMRQLDLWLANCYFAMIPQGSSSFCGISIPF